LRERRFPARVSPTDAKRRLAEDEFAELVRDLQTNAPRWSCALNGGTLFGWFLLSLDLTAGGSPESQESKLGRAEVRENSIRRWNVDVFLFREFPKDSRIVRERAT